MKVAFCLVGIVGGHLDHEGIGDPNKVLGIGYKHYKKHILDKNDCDVFCHTATTEMGEQILDLYKPKKHLFMEQPVFNIPEYVTGSKARKEAHYHKWFSHKKVSELRRQYEKETGVKYDMVYVGRYDICWVTDVIFSKFDNRKFWTSHWNRLYKNGAEIKGADWYKSNRVSIKDGVLCANYDGIDSHIVGYPHNDEGLMDSWFFSNPQYMDILCSIYDSLNEYTKPGTTWMREKSTVVDSSKNISNHRLIPKHLEVNNILKHLDFSFYVHDDYPLVRRLYYKSNR